ncbi:MAG: hypothetical protein CM1200mP15_23240 [Dehalococcoidia bacterium]|nr:MAG: hypothetical protein CM1200mP15_23240 [Dehalococcoidia bacterium]
MASLQDGRPVAVQQANLMATSFHPELTKDSRFHAHFLNLNSNRTSISHDYLKSYYHRILSSEFCHNGEGLDISDRYQIIEIFHTEPEG